HGVDFVDAETMVAGPCITFVDNRFDWRGTLCQFGPARRTCGRYSPLSAWLRNPHHLHEKRIDVSKKSVKSGLARLDRMKDSDIDYSDIPPLGPGFFKKATVAWPPS